MHTVAYSEDTRSAVGQALHEEHVSRHSDNELTPGHIREAIALLFSQGRSELASAVFEAAIALLPFSEDILVIGSLIAETERDWKRAEQLLIRLIEVQGTEAQAVTWAHLLRVVLCQDRMDDASILIDFLRERFPGDPEVANAATGAGI